MAKTIKLAEGFKITVDGDVKEFRHDGEKTVGEYWNDGMDYLNIPKDENLRGELFRKFFAFNFLDLTEAYRPHYKLVRIDIIPVGE